MERRYRRQQAIGPAPSVQAPAPSGKPAGPELGNDVVQDALGGGDRAGELAPLLRGRAALAAIGVDRPLSNREMQQVLRRARGPNPPRVDLGVAGGEALPEAVRVRMEAAFGHDFSHVRIHRDGRAAANAEALTAHAFAVDEHIWFGAGEWAPGTAGGDRLLAHELTHVVQHDEGRLGKPGVSSPTDPTEREAYANEERILGRLDREPDAPASLPVQALGGNATDGEMASGAEGDTEASVSRDASSATPSSAAGTGAGVQDDARGVTAAAHADDELDAAVTASSPAPPAVAAPAVAAPAVADLEVAPTGPSANTSGPANSGGEIAASSGSASVRSPVAPAPSVGTSPVASPATSAAASHVAAAPGFEAAGAAVTSALGQVDTRAAALRAEADAALEAAITAASAAIDAALARIDAGAAAAHAAVDSAAGAALAALVSHAAGERSRVATGAEAARGRADAFADELRASARAEAEAQAQRAVQGAETRAGQAEQLAQLRGGGDGASAQAQADAARRVAERTAEQCRSAGQDLAARCRADGEQLAGRFDEPLASWKERIGAAEAAASSAVDDLAASGQEAIEARRTEVSARIDTSADAARADITGRRAQVVAGLQERHAAVVAGLDEQAESARAGLSERGDAFLSAISGVDPENPAAAQVVGDFVAEMGAAGETAVAEMGAGVAHGTANIDASAQEAVAAFSDAGETLGARLEEAGAGASAEITSVGESARTAISGAVEDFDAGVAEGEGEFQSQGRSALQDGLGEMARRVDEGLAAQDQEVARARGEVGRLQAQVAERYGTLLSQAHSQSGNAQTQRSIWSDLVSAVSDLASAVADWFVNVFWEWFKGFIVGALKALVWVVALAIIAAILVFCGVAGWVVLVIGLVVGAILFCVRRYDEWKRDNGQGPEGWEWVAVIGLGILDLTGIPYMIEGLVGRRASGGEMTPYESGERFGEGLVALLTLIIAVKGLVKGRGMGEGEGKGGDGDGNSGDGDGQGQDGDGQGQDGDGQGQDGDGQGQDGDGQDQGQDQGEDQGEDGQQVGPRTLDELRALLSEGARRGFDQTREMLSDENFGRLVERFRKGDGSFDVDAAEAEFSRRALTPEQFEEKLRQREAKATLEADKFIKKINDISNETDGTNRPDAQIGDGTSESGLRHEIQTGERVGGRGHAGKCSEAIQGLRDAVSRLEGQRRFITDAAKLAEIDAALARARARIDAMRPAVSEWNNRVSTHPDVWNPDGTSKVTPGFPSSPSATLPE